MFLDPEKPIATCSAESCNDCPVGKKVTCHFRPRQLIHFLLSVLPVFLLGGAGIYRQGGLGWLLGWFVPIFGYFGGLEIRVMCSHCPHYAEPGGSLKCWANYGSPKLWKYRPGPMSSMEKILFFAGFGVILGYPLVFLLGGSQWFLLITFIASLAGFSMTLRMFLCTRCMNFACPLNQMDEEVREEFFARNPQVAEAWGWEEQR